MELPGFLLPERRLRDMAMKSLQQENVKGVRKDGLWKRADHV